MSEYETPTALRNDARTLAEDARALLTATSEVADEKVIAARRRLEIALESAKESCLRLKDRATLSAEQADMTIRDHPYEAIALAFGIGTLLGAFAARR